MRLLLAALSVATVMSADIVVFGDSWGTFGRTAFDTVARRHGLSVDNRAIGGTTAGFWSLFPNALRDAVRDNPDAKWVWLTIGGNDVMFKMLLGVPVPDIIRDGLRDTATFLNPLFESNPNIEVVQFGYDILEFGSPLCAILGFGVLPNCNFDTVCINSEFGRIQREYVDELSNRFSRHESVNLLGTMQAAAGIPNARPGQPNLAYFTPQSMMSDCIHANTRGYTALFDVLFARKVASWKKAHPEWQPALPVERDPNALSQEQLERFAHLYQQNATHQLKHKFPNTASFDSWTFF